jgi:hypothetical protein
MDAEPLVNLLRESLARFDERLEIEDFIPKAPAPQPAPMMPPGLPGMAAGGPAQAAGPPPPPMNAQPAPMQ